MKLLLISNSTNAGEPYLKYPMPRIDEFLGSVREVVFVPYAGITFSYAEYEAKVQARFAEYGIKKGKEYKGMARLTPGGEINCTSLDLI